MLIHLFRYKLIHLFHSKQFVSWVFVFPILLATLFYLGFGNLISNEDPLEPIPLAVVSTKKAEDTLVQVVKSLSKASDNQLFRAEWTDDAAAQKLLRSGKVDGILYIEDSPSLTVQETGLNQSILSEFLTEYLGQSTALEQISKEHPDQLPRVVTRMMANISYNQEIPLTDSKNGSLIQYFYALIAMVCLYGSILGLDTSIAMQPHLSALGARKNVTPVHKLSFILVEFLACLLVTFLSILLLLFYLTVILKIDFGSQILWILLTGLVGSVIGISFGALIGSVGRWDKGMKEGLSMGIIMLCCFLGGLMVNSMPNLLEDTVPWVNRINPANLIADSFYRLCICHDMKRYTTNLISMLVISAIFCLGSYLLLRRKTAN